MAVKEVNGSSGESIGAELRQAQFKEGRAKSAVVGQKVYVEGIYLIGCTHYPLS